MSSGHHHHQHPKHHRRTDSSGMNNNNNSALSLLVNAADRSSSNTEGGGGGGGNGSHHTASSSASTTGGNGEPSASHKVPGQVWHSDRYITTTRSTADCPIVRQQYDARGHVVETALALEQAGGIDGIDINCGCPQQIAKRGHYSAFLLEDPTHLLSLVKELSARLSVPVSVKVRLLPNLTMIFPTWRDRWPCTDNSLTPAPPC